MVDRFSGLRCRPGDLAVIVQDEPECRANIGQIVRVLCEYTEFPDEMGFHWLVEPQSTQPSPVLVDIPGKTESVLVYDNANRAHYDGWLRPLLYTQNPEELALLASLPSKTTAFECAPVHETKILSNKLTA
jgi:hypothetical protein